MKIIVLFAAVIAAAGLAVSPASAQKLGALPVATTINAADKIPASQNGTTTIAITPSLLVTYLAASFQPIDPDLSAIAALSTQPFGRGLLTAPDAATVRSSLGFDAADPATPWTSYTPTLSCGTGAFTSASAAGRYKRIGKTVFVQITISVTTNGSCGSYVISSVPVTSAAATSNTFWTLAGRERTATGKMLQGEVFNGSNTVVIFSYDNSFASANGALLNLTGIYESN